MLAGRVYRIFQRYADIHVAFEMPHAILRDPAGADVGRIDKVAVRRNRLWVSGQVLGQPQAQSVEIQVNRTRQQITLDGASEGAAETFSFDIPLETGPIDLRLITQDGVVAQRLEGVSPQRLKQARRAQALRFLWLLVCLIPEIYRWKWRGDLGAREVVKERLGLVPRPESGPLSSALLLPKADPATPPLPSVATLVMPVFNAFEVMCEALERVERHSGKGWRLILIEDVSTDARVRPFLQDWSTDPVRADRVTLICLTENLGFVGAINRGLTEAQHWPDDPVVLLNSDALVSAGWLPRMLAHLTGPGVASVTPMSNDAEIFSVPAICQRSDLAPGAVDLLDAAAARFDPVASAVEVPTGVGFCMALAPRFLAQVPLLDTVFGRGYGEENDWCQKTQALGGRHLGVGNIFVEHRGGESFGNVAKQRLLEKNLAEIARRYPTYDQQVQDFVLHDPLATARLALGMVWAGAHQTDPVPVYLAHAMGGGADNDLNRHIAQDIAAGRAAVVIRVGLRIRWQIELHTEHGVTRGLSDDTDFLVAMIAHLPRRRIVYSCGVGDRDAVGLPDILLRLADHGAHPVEILMHDYFPISPSYTLLGSDGVYHGVPRASDRAGWALADDPAHQVRRSKGRPPVTLAEWQDAWGRLMTAAAQVTVFSEASRDIVIAAYPQAEKALLVVPHALLQVPERIDPAPIGPEGPVIGVLGNIGVQKGAAVVQALSRELSRSETGRVVVIGYMDPDYRLTAPSQVHGAYELRDLPGLVARYGISCWLIPSIWPETFSFTTHEALATGLPVFAFDLGAQGGAVAQERARAAAANTPEERIGAVLPLSEGQGGDTGGLNSALILGHPALSKETV
ncbi:glycosyltransferase [Phaeobacter sp. J2-8]|uniref:glycosyltransferase n=1 Tax=Phaeobacter sp. J2-8 TaxID=2931394 RepID=UPI001FD4619E|nr:glycosyltransferase [Phaeobacter sp. J2-8]MCJ7874818.1 glycosyltransferase [Phaeobacter sp. J2-8]